MNEMKKEQTSDIIDEIINQTNRKQRNNTNHKGWSRGSQQRGEGGKNDENLRNRNRNKLKMNRNRETRSSTIENIIKMSRIDNE